MRRPAARVFVYLQSTAMNVKTNQLKIEVNDRIDLSEVRASDKSEFVKLLSYEQLDLVPPDLRDQLERTKIITTNFHAFVRREKVKASMLTKQILSDGGESAFTETVGEVALRVCRGLGNKKNIVVLNWLRIRDDRPKKGRTKDAEQQEPRPPCWKPPSRASTRIIRSITCGSTRTNKPALMVSPRRCSSSFAIIRMSRRWSSITSPVWKRHCQTEPPWRCRAGST